MNEKEMRAEYRQTILRRSDLDADPLRQFSLWFDQAVSAGVEEPNAMTLSTVGLDQRPSSRTVLYKGLTARGGVSFYTNDKSRKGREIKNNPFVALLFCWLPLARQIRIEGRAQRLPRSESETYFHSRPRGSQLSAAVSRQSNPLSTRNELEREIEFFKSKYPEGDEIPLPDDWGGYEVMPDRFEFWQGNENRLHDRFIYTLDGDEWTRSRLAP